MTIVHTDYRRKRPPKRKQSPPIPHRIVSARAPKPATPAIDKPVIERKRQAQPAAIKAPRIVTVARKASMRFGEVQDIDAEEHQRRGDTAVELFKELVRRASRE